MTPAPQLPQHQSKCALAQGFAALCPWPPSPAPPCPCVPTTSEYCFLLPGFLKQPPNDLPSLSTSFSGPSHGSQSKLSEMQTGWHDSLLEPSPWLPKGPWDVASALVSSLTFLDCVSPAPHSTPSTLAPAQLPPLRPPWLVLSVPHFPLSPKGSRLPPVPFSPEGLPSSPQVYRSSSLHKLSIHIPSSFHSTDLC